LIGDTGPFRGSATWSVFLTAKALRGYFEDRFAAAGSSLATFRALEEIAREGGRNQDQLARAMRIEGATLTRHLDRMEADGLIVRRRDPDDRRAFIVDATPDGRRLHGRLTRVAAAADHDLWVGTSDRDRTRVQEVLAAVRENAARITDASEEAATPKPATTGAAKAGGTKGSGR
jgi:MarR family transcriptional regulator, transcriptional regulator for hemolysin